MINQMSGDSPKEPNFDLVNESCNSNNDDIKAFFEANNAH
jgi:hypothetical protein